MAKGGKEERKVLYRAVRFELKLSPEQEKLILRVSDGLREIWNWALELRVQAYEKYRQKKKNWENLPAETRGVLEKLVKLNLMTLVDPDTLKRPSSTPEEFWEKLKESAVQFPLPKLPTLFDQINLLTGLQAQDKEQSLARANIPRNWKEETLDTLDGAFKSFFALAKNGDAAARPPWQRRPEYFCEVPGRLGFSVKGGRLGFAPRIFGNGTLSFPIPPYCQAQIGKGLVKKFTLFRDEPRLDKPGRYWVSLVYEVDMPEQKAFASDQAVYISLGASWLGVLSPEREQVIKLWRPDKHWKPLIDDVSARLSTKDTGASNRTPLEKGSNVWNRRMDARGRMFQLMSRQQKQDQREVVADLLKLGVHFVVQDMAIRGGLADASRPERGGQLGLNWQVQNTGSIARLVMHLKEKVKEHGGSVIEIEPALPPVPGQGQENKLPMAHRLKDSFLVQTP